MIITDYTIKGIKAYLKDLAKILRIKKHLRKDEENRRMSQFKAEDLKLAETVQPGKWENSADVVRSLRSEYRHLHIAYCEIRGKERKQIESKVAEGNEPDESIIKVYMDKINAAMEAYRKAMDIDVGKDDA